LLLLPFLPTTAGHKLPYAHCVYDAWSVDKQRHQLGSNSGLEPSSHPADDDDADALIKWICRVCLSNGLAKWLSVQHGFILFLGRMVSWGSWPVDIVGANYKLPAGRIGPKANQPPTKCTDERTGSHMKFQLK